MHQCEYPYCRHINLIPKENCEVCGFPFDKSLLRSAEYLKTQIADLNLGPIIDFHQILRNEPSALEKQLQIMQLLNVERCLLQSVPDQVRSIQGNKSLAKVVAEFPDRFILTQFVDPRGGAQSISFMEASCQAGCRIFKLLPCAGFDVRDPAYSDFFAKADELGAVFLVHTGFISARHKKEERAAGIFMDSNHGRPMHFDVLARKYAGVTFILAHLGMPWWEEAVAMAENHDNVFVDVSGSGLLALKRIPPHVLNTLPWQKIFWGNDSDSELYACNLRILKFALNDASHFLKKVLYENAAKFIQNMKL